MRVFGVLIAAATFLIDRGTKLLASKFLQGKTVSVLPVLSLRYAENRGAAFSIFSKVDKNVWNLLLIFLPLLISAILLYYIVSGRARGLNLISFSLILGGALGNIYDRLFYGRVVDFIDIHAGSYHWPTFNVADVAVFLGCLIVTMNFKR